MITIDNVKYVSVSSYAKLKGVTIQTVYNWIKDKKVETRQLLNSTLIKL
jgi:hypothetical protein